ncbi:MAG: N-formylglutamate deformylase [Cytophagales bacterium]|nr:N-formylglutamate deformylase [Cytophagales bacterium]
MPYGISNQNPDSPILVSVPHCGIAIPPDIKHSYDPKKTEFIDDTDWYVDKLYDFVNELGITMINAKYSRWVIDLNRNKESKPLYEDGRVITSLTPASDFNGNSIYKEKGPSPDEIQRRVAKYYQPYYEKIDELLREKRAKFKHVLFFDAHSIRQYVPGIRAEPFPDLILGDVDGTSANPGLIEAASQILSQSDYSFQHNAPFKGGNLTRHFGKPDTGIHALQLEMSKILYMYDTETLYHEERADNVRTLLGQLFRSLIGTLAKLNKE